LIEKFHYPRLGPGMMWEVCRDRVIEQGGTVHMQMTVTSVQHADGAAHSVTAVDHRGDHHTFVCSDVISSMPIGQLVESMNPRPPARVLEAAASLRHRDFLTVALVVPAEVGFPDNWIYIHSPDVNVGRIQNFGAWSPDMVQPGRTCLGLEYFVHEGDTLWEMPDDELVRLAEAELIQLGLLEPGVVAEGHVVRMPKAYPIYDAEYAANIDVLREWLEEHAANVQPVGRNGMHRYNNQDHSMLTAMYAVENILGAQHDLWAVNVEEDYHEEVSSVPAGTGRAVPVAIH
jgi:protoporphyrinogen oxidase